jgi:hydrogenase nickel incorporation protein HypA/HybF
MESADRVHEGSITSQIVESVLKEADKKKAKKVIEVGLVIGSLTFLNPEQVRFWYELLAKDTILEGSNLVIQTEEGSVRCPQCGYEGEFKYADDSPFHVPVPTLQCPQCDGVAKIVSGRDCTIKRIRMMV